VLLAHELNEGERYYIVLTTSSGLYRYNIHDLVRCVGYYNRTPMLEFLNKGSHYSSITGEKLSEFQVSRAVEQSLRELDLFLSAFTLAPCWADPPHYSLLVEEGDVPNVATAAGLADSVDRALIEQNVEYESKRDTHRLGPVSVKVLPTGTWDQFMCDRLTKRGATSEQYKHPSLAADLDFVRQFRVLREVLPGTPSRARKLA
jgi:sarcosine oxidase delta subunit